MKTITKISIFLLFCIIISVSFFRGSNSHDNSMPIVAIANWGPHSSLDESIRGIKEGLAQQGFKENENIGFEISDVSFDASLLTQMISKLKASKPKVFVAQATPVAQLAKNMVRDIPLVFVDITDPVEAGLLLAADKPGNNITGATDKQDLRAMLQFVRMLLPEGRRVGMLYSTSEANDIALVKMMKNAVEQENMALILVPIDQARDIATRMQLFKNKVDVIYVGSSGAVQPSLPTIAALAEEMKIPVVNMNAEEVKANKVFASFGVSYYKVGTNASKIIAKILQGESPSEISPVSPVLQDHEAYISMKRAAKIDFIIPKNIPNLQIVEE